MTRAGTKIQFTAPSFLLTPFVCLSADQFRFDQSWILPRKAKSPIDVVDVAIYQDVNNNPVVIYPNSLEEEDFFDLNNIENISEINPLMLGEVEAVYTLRQQGA